MVLAGRGRAPVVLAARPPCCPAAAVGSHTRKLCPACSLSPLWTHSCPAFRTQPSINPYTPHTHNTTTNPTQVEPVRGRGAAARRGALGPAQPRGYGPAGAGLLKLRLPPHGGAGRGRGGGAGGGRRWVRWGMGYGRNRSVQVMCRKRSRSGAPSESVMHLQARLRLTSLHIPTRFLLPPTPACLQWSAARAAARASARRWCACAPATSSTRAPGRPPWAMCRCRPGPTWRRWSRSTSSTSATPGGWLGRPGCVGLGALGGRLGDGAHAGQRGWEGRRRRLG